MSWNLRQILKQRAGIPVLILVAIVLIWGISYLNGKYRIWQISNNYRDISDSYDGDKYGGKTPEETYDLFINALKNGDTDLASRYFVLEKQGDWAKTFSQLDKNNFLENYIKEIEQNRSRWTLKEQDTQKYIYIYNYSRTEAETTELPISEGKTQQLTLPAGTFTGQVIFSKHPNDIWKIDLI